MSGLCWWSILWDCQVSVFRWMNYFPSFPTHLVISALSFLPCSRDLANQSRSSANGFFWFWNGLRELSGNRVADVNDGGFRTKIDVHARRDGMTTIVESEGVAHQMKTIWTTARGQSSLFSTWKSLWRNSWRLWRITWRAWLDWLRRAGTMQIRLSIGSRTSLFMDLFKWIRLWELLSW